MIGNVEVECANSTDQGVPQSKEETQNVRGRRAVPMGGRTARGRRDRARGSRIRSSRWVTRSAAIVMGRAGGRGGYVSGYVVSGCVCALGRGRLRPGHPLGVVAARNVYRSWGCGYIGAGVGCSCWHRFSLVSGSVECGCGSGWGDCSFTARCPMCTTLSPLSGHIRTSRVEPGLG